LDRQETAGDTDKMSIPDEEEFPEEEWPEDIESEEEEWN
jgi:hypothetical protein